MSNLDLMTSAARHQSLSARDRMIVDNLPLITHVCAKCGIEVTDDVLSWGILGLIKAFDRFDATRAKFSTFAYWCIRSSIWTNRGKEWRRKQREMPLEEAIAQAPEVEPTYSDEEAIRDAQAKAALEAMLPQDRVAVVQNIFQGMSQQQIASRLYCSKQNVNQRIKRGLRAARRAVA
jgi:RNA polymerase sigma factor (sigma-70 family)